MQKTLSLVVAIVAVSFLAACDAESPTSPSSTPATATTTAATPPTTPAFSHAIGASVLFGSTKARTFSVRLTGNLNALIDREKAFDWNGAQVDMYVYLVNGSRRKWTTEYGNSQFEGYRSTLLRDVDTDGAIAVVFQVYPRGATTPIPFTFPQWGVAQYFKTSDGVSRTVVDGLHYLKAALPAVTPTF